MKQSRATQVQGWRPGAGVGSMVLVLLLSAVPGFSGASWAQQSTPAPPLPGSHATTQPNNPLDSPPSPFGSASPMRLEKLREEERHKRLEADTRRLVELTAELKDAVEKAGKDQLSIDVVKKAAEIEKLARDVKDRMRS